ncbi:unnamed protein product [Staurois parvus]|nr:unnamed protein product [Staurois parvus]
MDKKRRHITKRILNLTLEIIYLLTGEIFLVSYGIELWTHKKAWSSSTSLPDPRGKHQEEDPASHPEDDGSADRRGSYKVSGCHCLFLHGGMGVSRRTQGSLQGRHDGGSAAPHITG